MQFKDFPFEIQKGVITVQKSMALAPFWLSADDIVTIVIIITL